MRKLLGLDLGDSKVGVAISDELGYTAQGMLTFRRRSLWSDLQFIEKLVAQHQIEEVVIGLPLKMNGTNSSQTEKVLAFCKELSKHLRVPVRTWDERLTTVQAMKILKHHRIRRKHHAPLVDKVAAVIILQGYLDRKSLEREWAEAARSDAAP